MPESQNELSKELSGSILSTNAVMRSGEYMVSPGRLAMLALQPDGNLCVYLGSSPQSAHGFVWGSVGATGYQPRLGEYYTIMQGDGNLCIITQSPETPGTVVFETCKVGHYEPQKGEYFAAIQDDARLCVYRSSDPSGLVWRSGPA